MLHLLVLWHSKIHGMGTLQALNTDDFERVVMAHFVYPAVSHSGDFLKKPQFKTTKSAKTHSIDNKRG